MATSDRIEWIAVDSATRNALESSLGSSVLAAENQPGGYSPSLAARCRLADGRRVFIKSVDVSQNEQSRWMLQTEALVCRSLPPEIPAPQVLDVVETRTSTSVVFEDVAGRNASPQWPDEELDLVYDALQRLIAVLDPSPVVSVVPKLVHEFREAFSGWRQLLVSGQGGQIEDDWARSHLEELAEIEAGWPEFADGNALVHGDIRSDNVLIDVNDRVVFVDWANASIGAGWLDMLFPLPSIGVESGRDPEAIWQRYEATRSVNGDALNAMLVALSGYFAHRSIQPAPPGLPYVRDFQARQGAVTCQWLRRRLS